MTEKTLDPEFVQQVMAAVAPLASKPLPPPRADQEIQELGLDSVAVAEMVLALEEEMGIVLELNDLPKNATFWDLQELVKAARGGA